MAKKVKSKLPVTLPDVDYPGPSRESRERERKYKAEDGLRALNRADEVRKDRDLMKDVKALAKEQLKACK